VVSVSATAANEQEQLYFFEVPSLKVEDALNRVAQQTRHQLLFSVDLVEPLQSPAVLGEYTVQQVLKSLLKGSNLSGRVTERGVIVIVPADAPEPVSEKFEMEKFNKGILAALLGLLSGPLAVVNGQAEDIAAGREAGGDRWAGMEEVVVTAQKRKDFAQSTAVALSALSGESLRKTGINNALDLNGISPSLSATLGNGQLQLTMRGAGNEILTSGIGEAGVAFHSNGIYLGSSVTPLLGFFDVERMEVMRGPQGTLWGRNSTGGAINVIQNRPTEEPDAYANFELGNYDTLGFEGALGGPLTDNMQGRIALQHRKSSGYLENKAPGQDNLGDDDSIAARGSLNINFGDNNSWLLAAGYGSWDITGRAARQEGTAFAPGTLNPTSGTPGELTFSEIAFGPTTPREKFETYSSHPSVRDKVDMRYFTSELSMEVNAMSLTLISDVRKSDRYFLVDPDFVLASVEESVSIFDEQLDEFSQEIRLASTTLGALDWLVGYYYYQQELDLDSIITAGPFPGVADTLFGGGFGPDFPQITLAARGTLKSKTQGLFAQSTYQVSDTLAATLGLRYSWDEKESDENTDFLVGAADDGLSLLPRSGGFDEDWEDWSGKVGLEYSPSENLFLFGNVAKGYKSGGINFGNLSGRFDPEELINYEVGLKSDLWDKRLRANITAYYSDYTGYQLQSIDGITGIITNADAEIAGLEMEILFAPVESWLLNLVATWTDSEITGYAQEGLNNPATGEELTTSQPLPRTPEYSYRLGVEKYFAVAGAKKLSARLTYTWQDEVNLDAFGTFNADEDAYGLFDAVLRYGSDDDSWSIDVYGKNLTDEYYKTSVFLFGVSLGAAAQAQVGAPRTYGVRFQRSF
jgi:iron complex outermembrane receptor protein